LGLVDGLQWFLHLGCKENEVDARVLSASISSNTWKNGEVRSVEEEIEGQHERNVRFVLIFVGLIFLF